jgi:hypothetical protein
VEECADVAVLLAGNAYITGADDRRERRDVSRVVMRYDDALSSRELSRKTVKACFQHGTPWCEQAQLNGTALHTSTSI